MFNPFRVTHVIANGEGILVEVDGEGCRQAGEAGNTQNACSCRLPVTA